MNELLPYVKEELGPIVQTPPIPVWQDHIDKFLELTKEYECKSSEDFEQAKAWADMGLGLKKEMFESFKPYFDFLDKLRVPIIERRNHDIGKVNERMNLIDSAAISWKRERDRIREQEQAKKDAEELQRRVEEREAILRVAELSKQIAEEFGLEPPAEPVVPDVVPPRHSAVESQFTYRKGKRTKPKLIAVIVCPDEVNIKYRVADRTLINLRVANWLKLVVKPTEAQVRELETEIGGVELKWE